LLTNTSTATVGSAYLKKIEQGFIWFLQGIFKVMNSFLTS